MHTVIGAGPSLCLSSRIENTHVIAVLSGEIDIASAPALREQLLDLLSRAKCRLVLDLAAVSYADASGLAVLVGTARRARLLGGHLRLAAPSPAVTATLRLTGVDRCLDIFMTVQAAMNGLHDDGAPAGATGCGTALVGAATAGSPWHAADASELRVATAAVLQHADAWRDADPRRQFTTALQTLDSAYSGTSHVVLTQAAQELLLILARRPLTHSPQVAASASYLRSLLLPCPRPAVA